MSSIPTAVPYASAAAAPAPQATPPPAAAPAAPQEQQADSGPPQTLPADFFDRPENALGRYPKNVQNLAKQLVKYDIPIPTGMALGNPRSPWNQAIEAAGAIDPTFKASEYQSRLALRKSFTSGKDKDNLTSLNTVIHHLATLTHAQDALGNFGGLLTMANTPINAVEEMGGDPRQGKVRQAANAVAEEMTKVFRGTGGSEQDIKNWRASFKENGSPDQQREAVKQAVDLLRGRIEAVRNTYQNGMGKPADFQFLNPQSRMIVKGMGFDPDEVAGQSLGAQVAPGTPVGSPAPAAAPNPAAPSGGRPDLNSFFRK